MITVRFHPSGSTSPTIRLAVVPFVFPTSLRR